LKTISFRAILFSIRRFLLIRHDMVETPDGLVDKEFAEEGHIEE
jgi:hypothetical protein